MSARKYIYITRQEFVELAEAFGSLAETAKDAAKAYENGQMVNDLYTDGMKVGVKGIDAICKVYEKVVGKQGSKPPKLDTIREKLAFNESTKGLKPHSESIAKKVSRAGSIAKKKKAGKNPTRDTQ